MGEKKEKIFGMEDVGTRWLNVLPFKPLPELVGSVRWEEVEGGNSERYGPYRMYQLKAGKPIDFDTSAPYWLRREQENKTITGAREEEEEITDWSKEPPKPDWETRRYQEWFEKEYDAVTRPNTGAGNEYYKQASTIELKIRVADLRRSNSSLWVMCTALCISQVATVLGVFYGW